MFFFSAFQQCLFQVLFDCIYRWFDLVRSLATCFFCPVWIGTSVLTNSICAFPPDCLLMLTLQSDPYSSYPSVIGQDTILWPPPYDNRSVVSVVPATWGSASTCDCATNVTAAPMHRRQTILRSNVHCPSAVIGPCWF